MLYVNMKNVDFVAYALLRESLSHTITYSWILFIWKRWMVQLWKTQLTKKTNMSDDFQNQRHRSSYMHSPHHAQVSLRRVGCYKTQPRGAAVELTLASYHMIFRTRISQFTLQKQVLNAAFPVFGAAVTALHSLGIGREGVKRRVTAIPKPVIEAIMLEHSAVKKVHGSLIYRFA